MEEKNLLGIDRLNVLKDLLKGIEKWDLNQKVEKFENKRNDYKQFLEKVIVTPRCTFRNLTGGAVVVTTWMLLRRSPNLEAFADAIQRTVLPLGTFLRALSEGSTRFTIQAENISALDALWRSYQDETLQKNLQEFLVTEEIKQLAGGEVTLTVQIDEDEYRNAMLDLINSGTKGDRLEKLDQVEGLIKDATEDWNSIQKAFKDAYPCEGCVFSGIEEELTTIRVTLGTLREMEKEWMNVESILTSSSSAQAIIQLLEKFLHSGEDYFRKPTSQNKKSIRGLARKAKNLKRLDVFKHLREITPKGTTGPQLPDSLSVKEIPKDRKHYVSLSLEMAYYKMWDRMKELDLRRSDMKYLERTSLMDFLVMQHDIRTVGELYDCLCEYGLPRLADKL
ncbi:unnamed protein product [Pocillopora meandrina]|uniref:DED domain-containing protein n=1 Tax=Pocillopora meandrina TaxID=46732 RepID=A0AAU9XTZ2_9CNID|nr:unnamed protein product [Pocillopora meandrina]